MSQFRKNQNQEGTYKAEQTIKQEIPLNQGSTMGSQSVQSGGSTMNTIPTTFSTTTIPTNDTYGITEPYISSTVLPTTQSCNVCEQSKNQCNVHNTTSNVSNTSTSTSTHHGEKVKEDKSHHKSHFPANIFHYHHGYDDRRGETWNETNMEKKVVNDQPMQQQPIQMQQQPMQQGMMSTNTNNTNTDGTTYYSKNTVLGDNNPSRLDNPNSIPRYEDTSLTRTAIPTSTMQNQSMTNQMPMHQPMQSTMQMNQQPMQPSMQMHQQNVMGVPVETVSMLEGSSFVPSGTPQGQYETGFKKQNDHNYHLRKKNHEPESTGPWQENLPSKNKPKYVVRKDD